MALQVKGEKISGIVGTLFALPWWWLLPGIFSLLGLAGAGVAAVWVGKFTPVFLVISFVFLGRAHYLLHWQKHGNRLSRTLVWFSTVTAVALWAYRFGLI